MRGAEPLPLALSDADRGSGELHQLHEAGARSGVAQQQQQQSQQQQQQQRVLGHPTEDQARAVEIKKAKGELGEDERTVVEWMQRMERQQRQPGGAAAAAEAGSPAGESEAPQGARGSRKLKQTPYGRWRCCGRAVMFVENSSGAPGRHAECAAAVQRTLECSALRLAPPDARPGRAASSQHGSAHVRILAHIADICMPFPLLRCSERGPSTTKRGSILRPATPLDPWFNEQHITPILDPSLALAELQ